ncbi:sugar kinase [Curtobacterium albidum]|uniref:Sugar kinase n=1 Tax=Curtobacterium citreum TaxID=2036 RepID=A0A850DSF7_9MICO|nr:sugar kinase [Curtobacterium albidum]NUU27871.1 sugar kinase [Curtobacterium albidum]
MNVLTLGEALGVLRSAGRIATSPQLDIGVGGAELNVAVGLRRLGVHTTWLGRLGTDGLGHRIRRELRSEEVELAVIDDPHPTGLILKERDALGRTVVTYHRGGSAGSHLTPSDLEPIPWPAFDLLHITGITPALSADAAATVELALTLAAEHGVAVSFDINHRASLWATDPTPTYRSIAERSDIVFAGTDEAMFLLDDPSDDATTTARRIAARFDVEAVIKRGGDGAVAASSGQVWDAPAVPTVVVDTVGAGDAFVAGYLAERLAGHPIPQRLNTATAAGAAACRHAGDWENAITRTEADTIITDPVVR